MDSRNVTIFSQSFFASGKTKNSNLSLACKRKNQLKDPVENFILSKETVSSDSVENEDASGDFSRSDEFRSNSTEMEKFLERFKNTRQVGRASLHRKVKQSGIALNKGRYSHDHGDKPKKSSEREMSDFKKSHLPSSDFVSTKTICGKELETVKFSSGTSTSDCHIEVENLITDGASVSKESDQLCAEKPINSDPLQSGTNESNILLCPLCWKPFDCKDAQLTHMKACATKHNVSTKQLLELLELIQRQEDERKALGLPLLPCKIPKKVKKESAVSSIIPKNALDGNIQLGIALSVSLKEAELQKERDHLLEAGLFDEVKEKGLLPDQEVVEDHPLPTAPIFLSVGKKDSITGIGLPKTRKKKKFGQGGRVPTLLKRTSEDREKLITEKVAIILVGDEQFNATLSTGDKENKSTWDIKSKKLRKYLDKEQIWWRMASLSPSSSSRDQFYVNCLSNSISPCKVVVGSKLKHLSQIPGRNNSPEKAPSIELHDCEESGEKEISLPAFSSSNVKLDPNLYSKKKDVKRNLFVESTQCAVQNTLSRDWNMLVGNHEMSDVTIYTQEDRKIPAHKLVFFARCPAILQELVEEETRGGQRSCMLLWVETCYLAALTFLKYIYAGVFNGAEAASKKTLEHLNSLAERYEVGDLLAVLEKVHCSKEEHENSMHISHGKVYENISIPRNNSSAFVNDGEDGSNQEQDGTNFKTIDSDVAMSEKDKTSAAPTPTTVDKEEKDNFLCDQNHGSSPRILDQNDSCQGGVEADFNINDTKINSPSISPIVSDLGRSSPDIFQATTMMDSPLSVEVLEDKPDNSEGLASTEKSSQESRESIEYLVSLMEKDSSLHKSTEDDPKDPDNVASLDNKDNMLERMSVSSHISESPSLVKTNRSFGDFIDVITPKTSFLTKEAEELIISSTPVVQEMTVFKKSDNIITKDEIMVSNEVKRKLQNLDKSDPASPNPKKICIEVDEDGKVMESGKREVVDLTLSGSEPEAVAEKAPLNDSDCSTLPPPVWDSPVLSPSKDAEAPSPSAASPCETYISDVWDDFDCFSDVHHVYLDEPICTNQKSFINMEDKGTCSATNLNGNEKNVCDESPKVDDSPDHTVLVHEEETEKAISSPIKSVQGSPDKEVDITEKLLGASLSKIDESVFWRVENEPREEAEKSNPSVSSQTPVTTCLKAASSKNDTPRTPGYLKQANVTPLADYSVMKTPILHKELDRYGIKHLKRNQAKQLLRHIYNELHPVVTAEAECSSKSSNDAALKEKEKISLDEKKGPKEAKAITKKKITFESLDSSSGELSSSEEGSDSNSDSVILEESMCESQFESPVKSQTLSQKGACVDIPTAMKKLIENDTAFHRKILLYEPIWLNDIKVALKVNGAKFNVNQLMDYLDEQCITFRIAQGNRHQRRKKASKKVFSLSQPCSQKRKNKETISCSQPG